MAFCHRELLVRWLDVRIYHDLTGLRASEAVESVRLINRDKDAFATYWKPERMALGHFRFSGVLLRQTKKPNFIRKI
jgi:hypothetical protein